MLQPGWKRYISKWWQRSEIILIVELTLIFLVKSFFTGKNTDLKSHRINMWVGIWVGIWGAKCPSSHSVICPFRMNFDFNGVNYLVIGLVPIRAMGICTLGLFPSLALRTLRNDKIINSRIRDYQSWPTAGPWSPHLSSFFASSLPGQSLRFSFAVESISPLAVFWVITHQFELSASEVQSKWDLQLSYG